MLNRSVDSGHPCLTPDFQGNRFSFSPLCMILAVGLSYIAFTMLSYFPSIPSFLRTFIMKWCWILSKAFCASIEMIRWFSSLLLLMFCITFIDFHIVRFCRVKTMPHVERKDLLDPDCMAAPAEVREQQLG
jgi:hypothetical protein